MTATAQRLLARMGPEVGPFERYNARNTETKVPLEGETIDFSAGSHAAVNGTAPKSFKKVDSKGPFGPKNRYLWVITAEGLFLQLEATPNSKARRKIICHSNLTAGGKALQGGELWFVDKSTVVINYQSGRYGADLDDPGSMDAVLEYFRMHGYTVTETALARSGL